MKILVINADCLFVNSSANLCHLSYIRGLVSLGYEVTILSADGRDYVLDQSMSIPQEAKNITYYGVSLYEKLALKKRTKMTPISTNATTPGRGDSKKKINLVSALKSRILSWYGPHGIYSTFARKARKYKSEEQFDYILSISTPPASHLLAYNLIKSGNIKGKQWIQIWEDPWYSDAYGFNGKEAIRKEERRLLSFAEKVCYVSPLTLNNQQALYPESAHKMYWQPLPYYYKGDDSEQNNIDSNSYGYFGDYAPEARNLKPFYEAAKMKNIEVNICGNPSGLFTSTEEVHIHPRLPLSELKPIEDKTNVLVFLCNRKGGQIPGKIYQYSATNKAILFILDGTDEEKNVLRDYFEPFNRYVFCENTVEDISRAIEQIERGDLGNVKNEPVEDFNPKETIRKVLDGK